MVTVSLSCFFQGTAVLSWVWPSFYVKLKSANV